MISEQTCPTHAIIALCKKKYFSACATITEKKVENLERLIGLNGKKYFNWLLRWTSSLNTFTGRQIVT